MVTGLNPPAYTILERAVCHHGLRSQLRWFPAPRFHATGQQSQGSFKAEFVRKSPSLSPKQGLLWAHYLYHLIADWRMVARKSFGFGKPGMELCFWMWLNKHYCCFPMLTSCMHHDTFPFLPEEGSIVHPYRCQVIKMYKSGYILWRALILADLPLGGGS